MPAAEDEIPADADIKSFDELVVGLPKDNLTVLGLAKQLAARIGKPAEPAQLRDTVRYRATEVRRAWALGNSHARGLETVAYRFEFDNGLSAGAVWLKAVTAASAAPATIVLNDEGRKAAGAVVSDRVNRGEQVLALDLLFTGDAEPEAPGAGSYAQLLATTGDRALGMKAAQLIAAGRWLKRTRGTAALRMETSGIRNQVAALVAAALEPGLFSEIIQYQGMPSLAYLLEAPVEYQKAPELFCLDLYKHFDIGTLEQAAGSTRVVRK